MSKAFYSNWISDIQAGRAKNVGRVSTRKTLYEFKMLGRVMRMVYDKDAKTLKEHTA